MYCPKCGAENPDNAYECAKCGTVLNAPQTSTPPPPPPPYDGRSPSAMQISNYLVPAILVTLLCCLPLGIPAIVFAAQVNGKVQAGDIQGAMEASKKAKLFTWLSFGIGLLVGIIYFVFYAMIAATELGGY